MLCCSLILFTLAAAPPSFPVFVDKGDLFVKAGTKQGLKVGSEVELLGSRIGDTEEHRRVGTRTVMEVWDELARLSEAEAPAAEKPERARPLGRGARPAQQAERKAPGAGAAARAEPERARGSSSAGSGKTSAAMGLNDHLSAQCAGHQIDVFGQSTLLGGMVTLQIDGQEVMRRDVTAGTAVTLSGKAGTAAVTLRVTQGMFGTDYALNVGGKSCALTNL